MTANGWMWKFTNKYAPNKHTEKSVNFPVTHNARRNWNSNNSENQIGHLHAAVSYASTLQWNEYISKVSRLL